MEAAERGHHFPFKFKVLILKVLILKMLIGTWVRAGRMGRAGRGAHQSVMLVPQG